MKLVCAASLLSILALTTAACDEGEDEVTVGDFFENVKDRSEEREMEECRDTIGACGARRMTSDDLGGLLGLPEPEMAILLDDAGFVPELRDDDLVFAVTAEDIAELAALSAIQ